MLKCLMPLSAAGSSADTRAGEHIQLQLGGLTLSSKADDVFVSQTLRLNFLIAGFLLYFSHFSTCLVCFFPPPQCHHARQHAGHPVHGGAGRRALLRPGGERQERREQDQPAHHPVSRE